MLRTVQICSLSLFCFVICYFLGNAQSAFSADDPPKSVFASPEEAAQDPDFEIQGEYSKEGQGVQLVALGQGEFQCVIFGGGLPGAGWDLKTKRVIEVDSDTALDLVEDHDKVNRKSPTMGAKPPTSAVVMFDGTQESVEKHWKPGARLTDDGLLMEGLTSVDTFGDCSIHIEFRLPFMPNARGQGRANSGIYVQGRYECQMLDSFGLEGKHNECGGIYTTKDPDLNMCYPPLSWQTYDIDIRSARFDDAGQKTENARITVRLNGVIVQNDVELPKPTPGAQIKEDSSPGPLHLQNHGNPVRYRNIWVQPRDFTSLTSRPIVPGFERFHTSPNADLEGGGNLLMGELNCIACHQADAQRKQQILTKQAPHLTDVGKRIDPNYLLKFISDPHAVKPGTTMPNLFASLSNEDRKAAVESIANFLASTGTIGHSPIDRAAMKRGRNLFHEVGCIACHAPQEGEAVTPPGTTIPLIQLEDKYSITSLADFLKNPHAIRPSGRMPNFNLEKDEPVDLANYLLRNRDESLDDPHWNYDVFHVAIQSLSEFPENQNPAKSGKTSSLDVFVAGQNDRFAVRFSGFLKIERDGDYRFHLGSDDGSRLMIDGATIVDVDGIHPHSVKSDTVKLSAGLHKIVVDYYEFAGEESLGLEIEGPGLPRRDISPLIFLSDKPEESQPVEADPNTDDRFVFDSTQVEQGRKLFASIGCASCHEMKIDNKKIDSELKAPALAALDSVKTDSGCLAASPVTKTPYYNLSDPQKLALATAIKTKPDPMPTHNVQKIHQSMVAFNCYACHSRGGVGGPEQSRNPLFLTTIPEMGDEGRIPPPLDGVADKLTENWLKHVLNNGAKDRPYMKTRMPKFGGEVAKLAEPLISVDQKTEATIPEIPESIHRAKATGRELVGGKSLSCIKCHTFGPIRATGIQAIDLLTMNKRLREDWFYRYLQDPVKYRPGTRMPNVFPNGVSADRNIYEGDPHKQISAMWLYLADGSKASVPYGLLPDPIELVAEKEPIIYRNFLEDVSPRGIGVGYPEKANLAYDANHMALRLIWHGAFIDAGKHWRGRGQGNQRPLGDHIIKLEETSPLAVLSSSDAPWPQEPAKQRGYQFLGYQLDEYRRPHFLYQFDNIQVVDALRAVDNTDRESDFLRELTITTNTSSATKNLYFRGAVGQKIELVRENTYRIWYGHDSSYQVRIVIDGVEPAIRNSSNQSELLYALPEQAGPLKIIQEIIW
ncbi:family 16 glycoside hydrolase [Rubinisphaera italica]|uniref:Cytochrome c-550 n=1 Tax=Rubinisphaera italica TaxID=2527969 RepID=A0A5C5XF05_9PLAN|nr:family 16 glycoside hydrolase [Rubinisphaera italica]TWT61358.1 Cytochrome c-550 [Rubinisphaera italica]